MAVDGVHHYRKKVVNIVLKVFNDRLLLYRADGRLLHGIQNSAARSVHSALLAAR